MSGAEILVVDDDHDIRETVSIVLQLHGYRANVAADGVDALEKLRGPSKPAAIIVDLMMPRMSGVDLVRALRQDPSLSTIPVIVLSGDAEMRKIAAALATEKCLLKPIDMDQLLDAVEGVGARRAA
jgi:CheY-like chemotaxis protein